MYDSISEWKESLDAHIQQNQAVHKESRPKGLEDMLLGQDYWSSSFYYVHVADLEWQKQKRHEDHFVKETQANKANVDQLMVGFEDPASSSTLQVEEMASGPVADPVSAADLQRGKQVANKLKRLGELLGKTSAKILMGQLSDEASTSVKKVEKAFLKARGASKEHYQKDDFKEFMGGLDGLVELLATAVPSLPIPGRKRGPGSFEDNLVAKAARTEAEGLPLPLEDAVQQEHQQVGDGAKQQEEDARQERQHEQEQDK